MKAEQYNEKLAVFDMDNTLIDSKAKIVADAVGTFYRLGVEISPKEAMTGNWYETAKRHGFSKDAFDESFNRRKSWEESLGDGEVPIFSDTHECLEELAANGVKMGLLSKSIPKYTQAKIEYFGLGKYFEHVNTVHPREPNKVQGALELTAKFNPLQNNPTMYFVGDKEEDVSVAPIMAMAWGAKTHGVYVNRAGETLAGYENATNLHEVKEYILNGRR